MKWFEGTIPEAIQLSKSTNALFVVHIFGDDDDSVKLAQSFDDNEVGKVFLHANCVAIKLHIKSDPGKQFSQIYPVVLVPCVFFIGESGVPLEVSGGYLLPHELINTLQRAQQIHSKSLEPATLREPEPSSSSPVPQGAEDVSYSEPKRPRISTPVQNSSTAQSADAENDKIAASVYADNQTSDMEASASSRDTEVSPSASSSSQNSGDLSAEEKIERARLLLAMKRQEKEREEEEKEKQREIERRKLGSEMTKLKQLKEERDKREVENSFKKQKEEERLAREKVRADIERDRQERAIKFHQEKASKEAATTALQSQKLAAKTEADARMNAAKMESARIQFRLPDASTVTNVFPSSTALSSVRTFILQKMPGSCKGVTLSTIYPKRIFTEADMMLSLLQLELAPSAIIIVLPKTNTMVSSPGDSGAGALAPLWWLVAQLMALWTVICNFLFSSPTPAVMQQPAAAAQETSRNDTQQQPSPSTSSDLRHRQQRSEGTRRHVDGNIHRLTADDEDDESATWNGNSTQQM